MNFTGVVPCIIKCSFWMIFLGGVFVGSKNIFSFYFSTSLLFIKASAIFFILELSKYTLRLGMLHR